MNLKRQTKILLIITLLVSLTLIGGFFGSQKIRNAAAQTASNVWGWAWNPNVGWTSFSSSNTGSAVNYGTNINTATGVVSGYAWANPQDPSTVPPTPNIGWLSFNVADTGLPPSTPFNNSGTSYTAQLDISNASSPTYNQLLGWGRFLNLITNGTGWVKLNGADTYSYSYNYQYSTSTQPTSFSKCGCDTTLNKDCASSFTASASDPQYCYDAAASQVTSQQTAYAIYPLTARQLVGYEYGATFGQFGWNGIRAICDKNSNIADCSGPYYVGSYNSTFWNSSGNPVNTGIVSLGFFYYNNVSAWLSDWTLTGAPFYNQWTLPYGLNGVNLYMWYLTSTSTSASGGTQAPCDTSSTSLNCGSGFYARNAATDLQPPFYYDAYQQPVTSLNYTYYIYQKISTPIPSTYGVSRVVTSNGCYLTGYAWSQDFGWINFGSSTNGFGGVQTSVCPATKPTAAPGTINGNGVTTNGASDYCSNPLQPTFNWVYSSSNNYPQGAYDVQVATDSLFTSTSTDIIYDSKKISSGSNTFRMPAGRLNYSSPYYWRVMVWDSTGVASSWSTAVKFSTLAQYPMVDFSWMPIKQFGGKPINFSGTNLSTDVIGSWAWNFDVGSPATVFGQNATSTFANQGSFTVTLTATSGLLSCSIPHSVNVSAPIPKFKEIAPTSTPQ